MKTRFALIVAVVGMLLVACGSNEVDVQENIAGGWKIENDTLAKDLGVDMSMGFVFVSDKPPDGMVLMIAMGKPGALSEYTFVDEHTIMMGKQGDMEAKVSMPDADHLVLVTAGHEYSLERMTEEDHAKFLDALQGLK
jgi:hypothetical protein